MENEQAKKNFLIKVGVISSAALIFIFWFLNFKNVFVFNTPEDLEEENSLNNLTQEFKETFDRINNNLEISPKNNNEDLLFNSDLSPSIIEATKNGLPVNGSGIYEDNSLSENNGTSSLEQVAEMAPRLYIDNNSSPLPVAPLKDASMCPAYVNCMPTIGEARQCSIPPGCEGITQFVY